MPIVKDSCKAPGDRYQLVMVDTLTPETIMWELSDGLDPHIALDGHESNMVQYRFMILTYV